MTLPAIRRIIRSTVQIIMADPTTILPKDGGSGCIIKYQDREILLTVAHVTNMMAATCIVTGEEPVKGEGKLYSVGQMNYLEKYDINKWEEPNENLKNGPIRTENIDTGLVDLSYAVLKDKANFIQQEIKFPDFTVQKGKKLIVKTDLAKKPSPKKEYGFFGTIKPTHIKGTPMGNIFETQPVLYGGLRFIKKINNYYEFELPSPIQDNIDFKGTSGAPIMDTQGNLVALITHGYPGATKIYGIALADFKFGLDVTLLTE